MSKKIPYAYYTDGATANNGKFGFQKSFICGTDDNGRILFDKPVGDKTCNEAELLAILEILKTQKGDIAILSDSQLAVKWIKREYKTKIDRILKILWDIWEYDNLIDIVWIPREDNLAGQYLEQRYGL